MEAKKRLLASMVLWVRSTQWVVLANSSSGSLKPISVSYTHLGKAGRHTWTQQCQHNQNLYNGKRGESPETTGENESADRQIQQNPSFVVNAGVLLRIIILHIWNVCHMNVKSCWVLRPVSYTHLHDFSIRMGSQKVCCPLSCDLWIAFCTDFEHLCLRPVSYTHLRCV